MQSRSVGLTLCLCAWTVIESTNPHTTTARERTAVKSICGRSDEQPVKEGRKRSSGETMLDLTLIAHHQEGNYLGQARTQPRDQGVPALVRCPTTLSMSCRRTRRLKQTGGSNDKSTTVNLMSKRGDLADELGGRTVFPPPRDLATY